MDPEDTSGFPPIVFPIDTLRFLKKGKQYVFYFDRIKYVEDRTFSDEGNNHLNQPFHKLSVMKSIDHTWLINPGWNNACFTLAGSRLFALLRIFSFIFVYISGKYACDSSDSPVS